VNESQSKFLTGNLAYIPKSTRRSSLLTRPRPHSYSTAVDSRNWARNCSRKHETMLIRPHERSMTKINSKNSLSPFSHFTEHLVDVFGKLPRETDLDHKSLRLSIQWLNSTPRIQPTMNFTQSQLTSILSSTWWVATSKPELTPERAARRLHSVHTATGLSW
jgi:hypothetical protein